MVERYCPLALGARCHPNNPAVITTQRIWTYYECECIIANLCSYLKKIGVNSQERVAFIAQPLPQTIFLLFALFRLEAIACPLSFREPIEKVNQLLKALDANHYLEPLKLPIASSNSYAYSVFKETNLATFLWTSGSSGNPKIACHTLGNYIYNALGTVNFFSLNSSSRWLLSLPLFHVGGLAILFRIFLTFGAIVLSDLPLSDALNTHQITHVSLIPTQLFRLLQQKNVKEKTGHLRCLVLGGAPFTFLMIKEAIEMKLPLITTYGMTEMSSLITAAKLPSTAHTGHCLPFREITLSSHKEILVRGKSLFSGYWHSQTKQIMSNCIDGWFPTHDLGELTKEGELCILGRMDRLFISGGENIHPEEIESALCSIKGIAKATVIAIEDPEFGQRPVAFIQDDTCKHTLNSIKEALCPYLPSFKHPIRLFSYPDCQNLKINYTILKELADKNSNAIS